MKTISDREFDGCGYVKNIIIPESVGTIGECAFSGCGGLVSVTISKMAENIGAGIFQGCECVAVLGMLPNECGVFKNGTAAGENGDISEYLPMFEKGYFKAYYSECKISAYVKKKYFDYISDRKKI